MNNNLSPQQFTFYHGSTENFKPGDMITPPATRGAENPRPNNPLYKPHRVYVTPLSNPTAYIYSYKEGDETHKPSGFIYEVEPQGRLMHDKEVKWGIRGVSYHAKSAKVIRKLDPNTMKEVE